MMNFMMGYNICFIIIAFRTNFRMSIIPLPMCVFAFHLERSFNGSVDKKSSAVVIFAY